MSVTRAAVVNHLVQTQRLLFADSEQVEAAMLKLKADREVTPELLEVLMSAQRTALRAPAQALFMVAAFLEPDRPPSKLDKLRRWIGVRFPSAP